MSGASSEHFSDKELACHHCGVNGCMPELVAALEALRTAVGAPVIVDDAYRCPIHNAEVGGVPDSEHVRGIAADIGVAGKTAAELEAVARSIPVIHGIGRADHQNYVHIDLRETPAEWCYDINGKWCGYYPPPSDTQSTLQV